MSAEAWAAWVQAIGSIVAIVGGFAAIVIQHRLSRSESRRQELRRRSAKRAHAIYLLRAIRVTCHSASDDIDNGSVANQSLVWRQFARASAVGFRHLRRPAEAIDLTDIASPMIWLRWSTLLRNLDYLLDALEEQASLAVPMSEGVSSPDHAAVLHVRSIFQTLMKTCDAAEESFEYDDAVGSLSPEKSEAEINRIIRKMVDEVGTD